FNRSHRLSMTRSQKLRDACRLSWQEVPFVLEIGQVQLWHEPLRPVARLLRSQQRVFAAENQLNRHTKRRELIICPDRNAFHPRAEVTKDSDEEIARLARHVGVAGDHLER